MCWRTAPPPDPLPSLAGKQHAGYDFPALVVAASAMVKARAEHKACRYPERQVQLP